MRRIYVVSQDGRGRWYAHTAGIKKLPIYGSFSKDKLQAQNHAAVAMGLTLKEYLQLRL